MCEFMQVYMQVWIYASIDKCLQDCSLSESCRKMTLKQGEERANVGEQTWEKHDFESTRIMRSDTVVVSHMFLCVEAYFAAFRHVPE